MKVLSWSLWDWGSAAFNAVIVTFVFSVYLTDVVGEDVREPLSASSWLGFAVGLAGFVLAVLAPVTGQRSDARRRRKRSLAILTASVVTVMAALFFVRPESSYLWLGLMLIAVGTVLFELAQVPYFAMLRQVSTPATVGRISGVGWSFGYFGGIVLLLICLVFFIQGDGGIVGLPTQDSLNIRLIALAAALWFAVFALPLFWAVPELPADRSPLPAVGFWASYRVLFAELKTMWRDDRTTLKFLVASALYRDGLAGVFTFGAVIAVAAYGFNQTTVLYFGVAANVASALGALIAGFFDDRGGPRPVIITSLVAMMIAGTALLFVDGAAMFWIFGLVLTIFVGPAQSASRSYLVRVTPDGKEGQVFGLYAMTGRAVSFLSPVLFGLAVAIGGDTRWGTVGILVVLGAGLAALLFVPNADSSKEEESSRSPIR